MIDGVGNLSLREWVRQLQEVLEKTIQLLFCGLTTKLRINHIYQDGSFNNNISENVLNTLGFVIPLPLGNLQGAISMTSSVVLSVFVSVSFAELSLGGMALLLCKQLFLQGIKPRITLKSLSACICFPVLRVQPFSCSGRGSE